MTRPDPSARPDVHADITRSILADLACGVRPWTRPWSDGGLGVRPLRHDGQPYHGINVLLLWSRASIQAYDQPVWMTFRQALALGGCVRRGEAGTPVIYAGRSNTDREEPEHATPSNAETGAESGPARRRGGAFLKRYTVFNLAQIDGLEGRYPAPEPRPLPARIDRAEQVFAAVGAEIRHGGTQAFYNPGADVVHMPHPGRFAEIEAYYAVLGHELTHWTGHPRRLARDLHLSRFGDTAYAREELIAELGAAFLCADLGLSLEPRPDHAAYLAAWLRVLGDDPRFIVSAAAHAERAVALLHGLAAVPDA
ncbi:MAG: ssDNA-binding domain-containing protein [Brevundimonas sp.]|uniref:ArdC family protein n=1 Tax=Brevundimonas sp. TaxID=1871086 RepID=UPI002582EB36|nr:zincin-like metallopeptidase domain-containing protein [Brevundimonas sp.]MCV0413808.1 ssDNA-binding domain-containing protein [Brevundimonas sp.]